MNEEKNIHKLTDYIIKAVDEYPEKVSIFEASCALMSAKERMLKRAIAREVTPIKSDKVRLVPKDELE